MSLTSPFRLSSLQSAALLLASSALLLSGCSMTETASEGNSFVTGATISGRVHGGNQPVAGATVNLYAVGTTGYGAGATLLATTTSAPLTGSFAFSQVNTQTGASLPLSAIYGCPTNSSLIYITASSGDPTGAGTPSNYNPNSRMMAAIGPCSANATTFVNINEVSTVVAVAALQQYINPSTEAIGSPSTTGSSANQSSARTGIANAFALVPNLINGANGGANATFTPASAVGTVTATVESAKINTIADILAACINTTGSSSANCTQLFAAATAPTLASATNYPSAYASNPTATDTLQAALFMLQNPADAGTQVSSCSFGTATTNIACLYNAQAASGAPFAGLSAAPQNWGIGITYASNSAPTVSGSVTSPIFSFASYLAIDKSGDVWVADDITTAPVNATLNASLVELSPQGGVLQQVLNAGQLFGPQGLAIDPTGNVWVPNFGTSSASNATGYGTTVVKFPQTGSPATVTVGGGPASLASDGAGNIFVAETSATVTNTSTGNGTPGADVREILAGGSTSASISGSATTYAADGFSKIAIDANFNVMTSSDAASVFAFLNSGGYTTSATNTTPTDSVSISVDNSNNFFVGNYASTQSAVLDEFAISAGTINTVAGSPYGTALGKTYTSAIDGAQNVWITAHTVTLTGPVVEFAHTGALLSPLAGYVHAYDLPTGIAIDPSGNVWIGNAVAYTTAAIAGSTAAGGYLTEIVGGAVPVVTPIAAGLPTTAGGASLLATTPQ